MPRMLPNIAVRGRRRPLPVAEINTSRGDCGEAMGGYLSCIEKDTSSNALAR